MTTSNGSVWQSSSNNHSVKYGLLLLITLLCIAVTWVYVAGAHSAVRTKATSMSGRKSLPHTVFDDILVGEAPATVLHEDDQCMVIKSNNPLAPVHFLVLPKKKIQTLSYLEEEDKPLMGHMMYVASQVAKQEKVDGFYRLVVNNDDTNIPYLHIHVLGGRVMGWPPG